jgi:two-component system C4-dicarboxylate transport response regulator DctD
MSAQVIVVDDEAAIREAVQQWLELSGFTVRTCASAVEALAVVDRDFPGIVVSDVRMPGSDGLQLLDKLLQIDSDLPVILVTGHGDVPMAVQALRQGAYDFIEKPFTPERLLDSVRRALDKRRLVCENRQLRRQVADKGRIESQLIGISRPMENLRRQILELAGTSVNVLIRGETGSGKERVARSLHDFSPRASKAFAALNCAAIPETIFESELFGHESGAFTGAQAKRIGPYRARRRRHPVPRRGGEPAAGAAGQAAARAAGKDSGAPRFEQEHPGRSAGHQRGQAGPARRGPGRAFPRGPGVPPQRRHPAHSAAARAARGHSAAVSSTSPTRPAQRHGREAPPLAPSELARLLGHDWPGNVRELINAAERHALGLSSPPPAERFAGQALAQQMEAFEAQCLHNALLHCQGNITAVMENAAAAAPHPQREDAASRPGAR